MFCQRSSSYGWACPGQPTTGILISTGDPDAGKSRPLPSSLRPRDGLLLSFRIGSFAGLHAGPGPASGMEHWPRSL